MTYSNKRGLRVRRIANLAAETSTGHLRHFSLLRLLSAVKPKYRYWLCLRSHHNANVPSRAFASFRSCVSNPSVNQPYKGASSSRACCGLSWSRQRRAMLITARSWRDFACCLRETASACSKYICAFAASGLGDSSVISPAVRLTSASHHFSW